MEDTALPTDLDAALLLALTRAGHKGFSLADLAQRVPDPPPLGDLYRAVRALRTSGLVFQFRNRRRRGMRLYRLTAIGRTAARRIPPQERA